MSAATSPARIEALDVLRGVAVCGILLVTIVKMGSLTDHAIDLRPAWSAEWLAWGAQTLFVDGAMRGLFTMLFGASMLLMLRRAEGEEGSTAPIDLWARRSLALVGFGTVLWLVLLWPGEILTNYGISGLFLLAVRTARPRALLSIAAAILAVLSVNDGYRTYQDAAQLQAGRAAFTTTPAGERLDPDTRAARAAFVADAARRRPDNGELARRRAERTDPRQLVRWSEAFWISENIGGSGWLAIAESAAFMMIGMALFRTGILTGHADVATYRRMALIGYGIGLAGRAVPVWLGVRSGLDPSLPAVSPAAWSMAAATFEPFRLCVTVGHAGLVLALFSRGMLGGATWLRSLGRMSLSVYVMQAAIGSTLFYGLGLVGRFDLPQLWAVAVVIWIATALIARWWLGRYSMGPAERLLRMLIYPRAKPGSTASRAIA